jgi:glycosyltransferase involved in cell wall biosynthesis
VTNFFKPSFEAGGVARVAYDISRHLVKNNHEVTVFTTNRSKYNINVKANRSLNIEGMKVYYFDNLRKYFPVKIVPIPYYLPIIARKEIQNFDVIHIHEHRSLLAIFSYHYARKYRVPYILQAHGSIPKYTGVKNLKSLYDSIIGYNIIKNASKLIAVSNLEIEQYKKIGVPKEKIVVIPNGIDIESFKFLPSKGTFKKRYDISEKHIILFLGRLNKIKGIEFLIKSYAELVCTTEDIVLVLAGSDDGYKKYLESYIVQLKLKNKVKIVGFIDGQNKLAAYVDADVLVYPSIFEIFGLVPFEALMCGTPVIITDKCGCSELIEDTKSGIVVKYGDEKGLIKSIKLIIENSQNSEKLVKNGQEHIMNNLSFEKVVCLMEKVYENCVYNT